MSEVAFAEIGLKRTLGRKVVFKSLKHDLSSAIGNGILAPGELIASENLLARKYKISRSSVRSALSELEIEGLIFKKAGKGTFVGDKSNNYIDEPVAIETIGLDIDLHEALAEASWYYAKILKGIEVECASNHCRLVLLGHFELPTLKNGFVDGVIGVKSQPEEYELYEQLDAGGVIPVLFNRITELEHVAYFAVDFHYESAQVIKLLFERGHKKIGVVNAVHPSLTNNTRWLGAQNAANEYGIEFGKSCCEVESSKSNEYYEEVLYKYLKSSDITALYLFNGSFMVPALAAIKRLKLQVPQELEIVCFDDVTDYSPIDKIPFLCVKMPLFEMGRDAAKYLFNRIVKGVTFPVEKKIYRAEIINSGYEVGEFNSGMAP